MWFCGWDSPSFIVCLLKKSFKSPILTPLQWLQSYASSKVPGVRTKICWNMSAFMKTHYLRNNRQTMCSNLTQYSCYWDLPHNSSQAILNSQPSVLTTISCVPISKTAIATILFGFCQTKIIHPKYHVTDQSSLLLTKMLHTVALHKTTRYGSSFLKYSTICASVNIMCRVN